MVSLVVILREGIWADPGQSSRVPRRTMACLDRCRLKPTRFDLPYQFFALDCSREFLHDVITSRPSLSAGPAKPLFRVLPSERHCESFDLVVLHQNLSPRDRISTGSVRPDPLFTEEQNRRSS